MNRAHELHSEAVSAIWQDPLLRHSNILDGIFHDRVVICESDSDCHFFSAVLSSLPQVGGRAPQIMFTHCGGKARVPMVARALSAVKVPVSIVCDFDVLNAERPLRDIVEATGNSWSIVEKDWRILWASVNQKKPEFTLEELKAGVLEVVTALSDVEAIKTARARISDVLKKGSAWSQAKSAGLAFIPNGDATQAANRLFSSLHAMGIFVVPCGELEQFCKSVGGHGPAWTNQALQKTAGK